MRLVDEPRSKTIKTNLECRGKNRCAFRFEQLACTLLNRHHRRCVPVVILFAIVHGDAAAGKEGNEMEQSGR